MVTNDYCIDMKYQRMNVLSIISDNEIFAINESYFVEWCLISKQKLSGSQ